MINKKFLRSIFSYTIFSFLEKGMNFALTFLLSYYLIPEEMGVITLYMTLYVFLHPFINLYTNGANLLAFHQKAGNFKQYFSTTLLINIGSLLFFVAAFAIFFSLSSVLSEIPLLLLLLMPVIAYLDSVRLNYLSYSQAIENVKRFGLVNLTTSLLTLAGTFVLLHYFNTGYSGRIYGLLIGGAVAGLLVLYYLFKDKLFAPSKREYTADALRFGIPLIPHAIGLAIISISDRFFINYYAGKTELGLYSVAYTFASILSLISVSFLTAWSPRMNALLFENTFESKVRVGKTFVFFLFGMVVFTAFFFMISPVAFRFILDERYASAVRFLPWLTLFYFLQAFYFVFSSILFYTKKTSYFMWVSFMNIVLNIALNYLFIPRWGAMGAAYASVISMAMFLLAITFLSNKLLPIPWLASLRSAWSYKSLFNTRK